MGFKLKNVKNPWIHKSFFIVINQFFLKQHYYHFIIFSEDLVEILFQRYIDHLSMKTCSQVLPWGSVCWLTAVPSHTRFPVLPSRHCAYVLPRWGCACRCARSSYPWKVPPRGSAARGWHRPSAPDGPRCDFAVERVTPMRDKKKKTCCLWKQQKFMSTIYFNFPFGDTFYVKIKRNRYFVHIQSRILLLWHTASALPRNNYILWGAFFWLASHF